MTEQEMMKRWKLHKEHGEIKTYIWQKNGQTKIVDLICSCGEKLASIDGNTWKQLKKMIPQTKKACEYKTETDCPLDCYYFECVFDPCGVKHSCDDDCFYYCKSKFCKNFKANKGNQFCFEEKEYPEELWEKQEERCCHDRR